MLNAAPPAEDRWIGSLISGRYRVVRKLGEGGMGAVYLGQDEHLPRPVALKVVHRELAANPEIRKRVEAECRILAQTKHENVVVLYDREEHEGNLVLVMEYCEGETLADVIRRTRAAREGRTVPGESDSGVQLLGPEEAREILAQCLSAIAFAHARGVVHRDLKPANIIVRRAEDGRLIAKVMDFGIAKAVAGLGDSEAMTALTRAGGGMPGTPAYMAPEQIDPARFGALGPAADIYAMGVTAYETFALRLPFNGTFTEILNGHANIEPPDPRTFNAQISDGVSRVIQRALRKRPADRYLAAADFRMDLLAAEGGTVLGGAGAAPLLPATGSRNSARAKLHSVALYAGFALALLSIATGAFLIYRMRGEGQAGTPSPTPAPPRTPPPPPPVFEQTVPLISEASGSKPETVGAGKYVIKYLWTAPAKGAVKFWVRGTQPGAVLTLGSAAADDVGGINPSGGPTETNPLRFETDAQTLHRLSLDGSAAEASEISIHWKLETEEPSQPAPLPVLISLGQHKDGPRWVELLPGTPSVECQWTAPEPGTALFWSEGAASAVEMSVTSASSAAMPSGLDFEAGIRKLKFKAVKGNEYTVTFSGYEPELARLAVYWSLETAKLIETPPPPPPSTPTPHPLNLDSGWNGDRELPPGESPVVCIWTAPDWGKAEFTAKGLDGVRLEVRAGSSADGELIERSARRGTQSVNFKPEKGADYRIEIETDSARGDGGRVVWKLEPPPPPPPPATPTPIPLEALVDEMTTRMKAWQKQEGGDQTDRAARNDEYLKQLSEFLKSHASHPAYETLKNRLEVKWNRFLQNRL